MLPASKAFILQEGRERSKAVEQQNSMIYAEKDVCTEKETGSA